MALDHFAMVFFYRRVELIPLCPRPLFYFYYTCRSIGRIALPIFIFLMSEGFKYTRNKEKYLLRSAFKDIIPDEVLYRKKNPYPKTHHPYFLNEVKKLLKERLKKGNLDKIFNIDEINKLLDDNNDYDIPWFGQLMTKPQLIAYLYQFDLWIEKYNIEIKL